MKAFLSFPKVWKSHWKRKEKKKVTEERSEGPLKELLRGCSVHWQRGREREDEVDRYYFVLSHSQNMMSSPGDWLGRREMYGYKTGKLKHMAKNRNFCKKRDIKMSEKQIFPVFHHFVMPPLIHSLDYPFTQSVSITIMTSGRGLIHSAYWHSSATNSPQASKISHIPLLTYLTLCMYVSMTRNWLVLERASDSSLIKISRPVFAMRLFIWHLQLCHRERTVSSFIQRQWIWPAY